jgi:hypothetical protein
MGRVLAVYTALRAVAFAGAYGLLILLGVRSIPAVVGALFLSAVLSLLLLKRQRQAVADALAERHERRVAERERLRGLLDETRER